jgi:RNA polymerase sigma-70 factor (ECF subfamily)
VEVVTEQPSGREPGIPARSEREAEPAQGASPSSDWERTLPIRLTSADDAALGELYDQYSSFVYGLALRVVADPRAAEDVSQEVFLYVWEHPERFDAVKGSLRTWLGLLTHRRAVDHVRREESRRRRTAREASRRSISVPDVEEMASALVTAERVRSALDLLPEDQRRAIDLAYFGGQTYRQVALTLGIPEGTAKSRLRLGLRRVAEALQGEGLEEWV